METLGHRDDLAVALIGRHSELLSGRLPGNVAALGRVEDDVLAEYLAGADLALNPIDEGSGSNLKLIDYFAAGVPVITTPVGARGIAEPRRFALLAPSDGLAEAVDRLEVDPGAEDRARAARVYAEEHLDWRLLGARMAELTLSLARSTTDRDPDRSGTTGAGR
ncbi:MAG: glycosyltransferase [Microthrixaceae bacterium]